jgi:urease accessory protein
MGSHRAITIFAAVAGILIPSSASAHLVDARFGDFYAGLVHPLTALEHVFPFLAVGLLAGQQGARSARAILGCFALALIAGAVLGRFEPGATFILYVNGASFVVLGGLVALARRLPVWVLFALSALFGLTHGYANGTAMTSDMLALNFVAGMAGAGVIVVSLGAGVVLSLRASWTKIAVRVVGSWIAAIGLMTIALVP